MIKISFLIFYLITSLITIAQNADEIIGKYHLPNKLDIEIFKDGDSFSGKIIALNNFDDGQTKDVNNPEDTKQNDPLLGMVIIHNLKFDEEKKQWLNGKMYGPEKGMIFNLKITDMLQKQIEVVGSKYFFWRTMKWDKI